MLSRWVRMEMYSPAAMEKAPANNPTVPAITTASPLSCVPPATPITNARFETSPSEIPKIAARNVPLPVFSMCSFSPWV